MKTGIIIFTAALMVFSTRKPNGKEDTEGAKPNRRDNSFFLDLSEDLYTTTEQAEEEAQDDDDGPRQKMSSRGRSIYSSLIIIPRHETAAPLFHQWYDERPVRADAAPSTTSTTSTTNNSRTETPLRTRTADATQSRWHKQQQQQPPRAIPSKTAFLQSIHDEEVLASRRRRQQQGQRPCCRGPSHPWPVHGGRHSSWCCYGLAIAIIVSCGSCVLPLLARCHNNNNNNKGRRDHPTTESFSSSASSSDSTLIKLSSQSRLFPTCCAFVASSCLAHFPTAVEILGELFSWTGHHQQPNVPDEAGHRRIGGGGGESDQRGMVPNSSSSSVHEMCTSGHDTDDSVETLCSGGEDDDDDTDTTTPNNNNNKTIFVSFSDETMAWIANHIERNETIHNTSFVDRETPLTGQAINFFHHFRFDEAGIEWM